MYYPGRKATPQPAIQTTVRDSEMHSKPLNPFTSLLVAALALIVAFYAPSAHGQANVHGTWQTVPAQMPINPIHTALLSNGKILVVSGSGNYPVQTTYYVGVWDPSTNTMTTQTQSWDMFCNGMIVLPDGRPFIMGGNLQYDPFFGWNRTSIYNPAAVSPKPNYVDMEDMAHGRWYPTSTVLGDGRVLIFSGLDEKGATNSQTEIYTVGAGWAPPVMAPWTPPLYPRMHVLPNGKVFYSGSTTQSRIFDPVANAWSGVIATTIYGGTRTYGSSVLLPLNPPNYVPKVIIFGGGNPATATTEIIDLSVPTPAWTKGPAMSAPRIEMNATILPNGQVLTVGGSLNDEDSNTASLNADLYDPATNKMFSAGANAVPRLYHSVALLLPDATVWVAGGNPTRGTYEPSVEIYSPAYLFNPDGTPATRPAISSVTPSVIGYGSAFQVQTPDAANIASVVLVKDGAVTHAFNMDQRLVGLVSNAGSGVLNVTGPPNGNIAPPGYYMLFLINKAGVPSLAKFVQISTAPTDVPPTGNITSPVTSTVMINQGQSVTFSGTGTATAGTITRYSWSIRGGSPATSSLPSPGAVTFSTPGTYQASLTVTDTAGLTDPNPPVVTITVKPVSPQPTLGSATTGGLPAAGAQAQTNLNVVLTGTNFLPGPICSFGAGVDVNSCTFNSATQLTANVNVLASAAVGTRNIVVTDTDTQTASLPNGFSVVAGTALPAPTLTGITPNAVFQGTTNVTITLTGTNFQPAPKCNFDADFGGTVNTCTYISPTQINVNLIVAAGATLGGHNVIVTNADGQSATMINGFTIAENLGNTVKLEAGFTAGAMVMNGNAQLNELVLELTDGRDFEASSAWYATRVNVQNFVTDFTFQITPGLTADGITFAIQNNSTAALGVAGGSLGYGPDPSTGTGGIPKSVALKFDLYSNSGEGIDSTGLYINGASPTIPFVDMTGSGVDLHSGDVFKVHMIYDGVSLAMTVTDTVSNAVFTHTWTIDIPGTIGATTAYAGFTGGTGGLTATQSILTWTLGPIPVVGFAPASPIDFPDVATGTSTAPISITVTNTGGAPLHITSVTVTGTNPTDFAIPSNTCTAAPIAVNATCTVGVTFTPSGTGERLANLQFTDDASSSPQILALSGNGLAPATPGVTVVPSSPIMLPSTTQGATSAPVVVTVTNSGNAALNISAVTLTGVNAGDFALASNTCTGAVAANATCTVRITFTPSATGARQANLQITDNAPASPQVVAITGNGLAPATPGVTVAPSSPIMLPSTTQGATSAPVVVTVTNSGNATLNVSAVTLTGVNAADFTLASNTCTGAVAPSATCKVGITFTPSAIGARQANLQITDNAPASPQVVAITGNGLAPATPGVTVAPSSPIMLPSTTQGATSAPVVVTVTNSGNAALNISAVALTGVNAGDFALASNTCTAVSVAANATCTIAVAFTPSATGVRQANLQITDNVPASPQSFTLSGTGTSPTPTAPAVVITPAPVTVAGTEGTTSNSANIVISNSGTAPLHISGVVFGGANVSEFGNPSNPCVGTPITPKTSCSISLTFAPLGVGTRTETVTITDDAPNSPQAFTVNGTASPAYTVTSASSALTTAVTAGQTAQYSLQLTPGIGYSGPVTMACSGAPATTTCTVTNPIQLTAGVPTAVNVTVTTVKSSLAPITDRWTSPPPSRYLMLLILIMCLAALVALNQLKQSGGFMPGRLAYAGGLLVLVLAGYGLAGCASGGVSTVNPTPTISGTQKGTYTLTLTPTASSMSGKPLQLSPIQLTLTVN
jgi:Domain of unknown function (DUF1929)/Legume lectin domain/PKD domain/Abnormal spindle-like microcephaly-assoc'd, ASPM-SPD-2-Hydin/Quinohemoprotein amine dehydrogenase, alpha subunit domain III